MKNNIDLHSLRALLVSSNIAMKYFLLILKMTVVITTMTRMTNAITNHSDSGPTMMAITKIALLPYLVFLAPLFHSGVQLVSPWSALPAHSGGLSGPTVPRGNMIWNPMMIVMTRLMIVITIMSMKMRARMHMTSKCTKQSCSDKLWVENISLFVKWTIKLTNVWNLEFSLRSCKVFRKYNDWSAIESGFQDPDNCPEGYFRCNPDGSVSHSSKKP